jgi:hypothetical protein
MSAVSSMKIWHYAEVSARIRSFAADTDVVSTFDSWVASLGGSMTPEARTLLRRIFDQHGPVSSRDVERIGQEHQVALARVAVDLVGRDITATTDQEVPPFECRYEKGALRVAFWGRYATTTIAGLTQQEVTVEVAEFLQEEFMRDLARTWPGCPDHRAGLHPSADSGRAAWTCRAGGHVVAAVGELPPSTL